MTLHSSSPTAAAAAADRYHRHFASANETLVLRHLETTVADADDAAAGIEQGQEPRRSLMGLGMGCCWLLWKTT